MCNNDFIKYEEEFQRICDRIGWVKHTVTRQHERDWNCSWEEIIWKTEDGIYLFSQQNLTEGFILEMIRIVDANY